MVIYIYFKDVFLLSGTSSAQDGLSNGKHMLALMIIVI